MCEENLYTIKALSDTQYIRCNIFLFFTFFFTLLSLSLGLFFLIFLHFFKYLICCCQAFSFFFYFLPPPPPCCNRKRPLLATPKVPFVNPIAESPYSSSLPANFIRFLSRCVSVNPYFSLCFR